MQTMDCFPRFYFSTREIQASIRICANEKKKHINNHIGASECDALAANVRVLKPIQLDSEILCSRDVTLLRAEGVFSIIIEEIHEQKSANSLKLKEALISSL